MQVISDIVSIRSVLALCALGLAFVPESQGQYLKAPQPGEVFRDTRLSNGGETYRVTDLNATHPDSGEHPNTIYDLNVPDLVGAVRAELIIDHWGGHLGTGDKSIRLNGNEWIDLPDLASGNNRPNKDIIKDIGKKIVSDRPIMERYGDRYRENMNSLHMNQILYLYINSPLFRHVLLGFFL